MSDQTCDREHDQPDPFHTGQCTRCEVEFFFAGQGEHLRHLCQSCEEEEFRREDEGVEQSKNGGVK